MFGSEYICYKENGLGRGGGTSPPEYILVLHPYHETSWLLSKVRERERLKDRWRFKNLN